MPRTSVHHLASRAGLTLALSLVLSIASSALPAAGRADGLSVTKIGFTDSKGDNNAESLLGTSIGTSPPELDILGGNIVQNRPGSMVQATILLGGASTGIPALLRVALGYTKATGHCDVLDVGSSEPDSPNIYPVYIKDGTLHLKATLDTSLINSVPAYWVLGSPSMITGAVTKMHTDATVTLSTDTSAYFASRGWDCAQVTVETVDKYGFTSIVDTVDAFAPDDVAPGAPTTPKTPISPSAPSSPKVLDTDSDGLSDASDACPAVPGSKPNGCETTSAARSIVLGTKRVVVDRLVPLTAAKCPPAVTVTAMLKGKTLGKRLVGTLQHGKFCQVKSVVALKKKVAKARVVIRGTGVTEVGVTVVR